MLEENSSFLSEEAARMSRGRFLISGSAAVLGVTGAGRLAAAARGSSFDALKRQNATLAFPVEPTLSVVGFFSTKDHGFFERNGINANFVYGSTGVENIAAVESGRAQFTYLDPPGLANLALAGHDFVGIYQYVGHQILRVFALKKSGFSTIADLRGKKIGVSGLQSVTRYSLDAALAVGGLKESDVELVPVGAQRVPALLSGQIDALSAWDQIEDLLRVAGDDVVEFSTGEFASTPGDMILTTRKILRDKPQMVRQFLRAAAAGQKYSIANPRKVLDSAITFMPAQTRDGRSANAQIRTRLKSYADFNKKRGIGWIDVAAMKRAEAVLVKYGALPHPVGLASRVTNAYLPQAKKK